jgi:hypothetical protein
MATNSCWFNGPPKQNADIIRLWAKYFAPIGASGCFNIPQSWRDLITVTLLNPSRFEWTRILLRSQAWNIILNDKDTESMNSFSVPQKWHVKSKLLCLNSDSQDHDDETTHTGQSLNEQMHIDIHANSTPNKQNISPKSVVCTSTMHQKRKQAKAHLVDSEVRRSERLKEKSQGFMTSSCPTKSCICCNT